MRKRTSPVGQLGLAALVVLFGAPPPLYAQGETSFTVCNAGKTAIDVYLARPGEVSSTHVGAADCGVVAESAGGMAAAYVGFGTTDASGQWKPAPRLGLFPDLGAGVLTSANQTVAANRGNSSVSLPLRILFSPRAPTCDTYATPSAVASLPPGATPGQRSAAQAEDARRPPSQTVCETLNYTLNVEAFADTGEVTFKPECDPCDRKAAASVTPEERAATRQRDEAAKQAQRDIFGAAGVPQPALLGAGNSPSFEDLEKEQRYRDLRLSSAERVSWDDLLTALQNRDVHKDLWEAIPRNLVIRGTIAKVEVRPDTTEPISWYDIVFREAPPTEVAPGRNPAPEFDVCTSDPEILATVFGKDFVKTMVGKVVEVEGESEGGWCRSVSASIRITLAHQIRPAPAGKFEATWHPPAPAAPDPAPTSPDYRPPAAAKAVSNAPAGRTGSTAAPTPPPAAAAPVVAAPRAPPPVSAATASAPASPAPAKAETFEQQSARLAREASERYAESVRQQQKQVACLQEVMKKYPDGGASDIAGYRKTYDSCLQAP